ncbi:DUF262 domain-containing protein [Flavobacterium sp. B183]|uniref:DUF262 domain-containing protein n=1 Tax=Flavobacterium sp. B183 TaxID=907046 RepID=UPI00201F356D|nr:DUF262 domain-containing protein [Flavobacterium sp. B183]URC14829.1 DUF262 domain-containing protein [Flavobacterium sp. B183]
MITKEYSFWNLISTYKIEIPAIQRDYAQGRKGESRIANALITDLHDVLNKTESKKINLHFVYGKTDNDHLIPLDGQQRLTTLFLLHWFLSIGKLSESAKKTLAKFSYETRPSSEDFCLKLVKESLQYEKDLLISEQLENAKWFFLSWKNDPTISAMLNMLNIIQSQFKHPDENLFNLLIGENSPVQFHFLPLEKFKLDDKIYVKMNSRGKPLTEFENFKANFSTLFDNENKSKLDNEWLDIFWKYEKGKRTINIKEVDDKYLNFIINSSFNFYAEITDVDKKIKDNFNIFDEYKNIYQQTPEYLNNITLVLDALTTFSDDKKYFDRVLEDDPDYWERLRFYAVMQFFIKKGNLDDLNTELYKKWMRVCVNLINNTLVQSPDAFYKAVRSIKKLSDNIDGLYEYLSQSDSRIESFLQKQIDEEKIKAALILQTGNWKTEILKIESHNYFSGQIGFILDFSKKNEIYDFELFKDYSLKLATLFSNEFKEKKNSIFQRALLAFGDYLVPINYCRTFCSFNSGLREKMDNWRKVFDDGDKKIILKNLLDAISIDTIDKDMKNIIENYSESDWKSLIIKNNGILEYCDKYRIAEWENKIALSRSSADNWRRHADLYSYTLFLKLRKELKKVDYRDSSDDVPWILINWKDKYYYIQKEDNGFSFGHCKGNDDQDGLVEMKEYAEKIIVANNLQRQP